MVLIEAEQKQGGSWQVQEERTVQEREEAAETGSVTISVDKKGFFGKLAYAFKRIMGVFSGADFRTIGLTPKKKAEFYVTKCWNHMARNEVAEAKESYGNLVKVYEELEEGPVKSNLYHEVYDIYQRISQV